MIKKIVLALGSNLGDRENYLKLASEQILSRLELVNFKQSKILKNPAMLLPDSPKEWNQEFLNQAISGDVDLDKFSPKAILKITQQIEKDLGRGDHEKWSPRVIDIDILVIGEMKIRIGDVLTVPHPGLLKRDFFVKTVMEIEPEILEALLDSVDI